MKRSALSQAGVKKSLSLLLMVVMALNVFAFPVMASNDVAYIFKSKAKIDDNVIEVFEDKGLDVDLIDEKELPSDFSSYRFVYLGDERFRNDHKIEIWNHPTIVSNYFYGEEWGLTDRDGISQLVSTAPLSVKIGHKIVEVYTEATIKGIGIPYYYLDGENKADDLFPAAETYTTKDDLLGDVVSFGAAGIELENGEVAEHNICFYGIVESDYWTGDAVELFEECIDFVGVACESDNDCSDENLGGPYCVGNQVFQNVNDFSCVNPGTVESQCVSSPDQVLVETCSASCSNGACFCDDKDNDGFDECPFGSDGDDGNNLDCNDNNPNVNPGLNEMCGDGLDNNCNGHIDEGCPVDLDNDGFDNANPGDFGDDGKPIDCRDDVFAINPSATEVCDFVDNDCDGIIDEGCSVDEDGDGYDNTDPSDPGDDGRPVDCNDNDDTVHPNAFEICDGKDNDCDGLIDESDGDCGFGEVCSLGTCTAVECNVDTDCGNDGFFDGRFCGVDGVYQNYIDYTCENPGTISSSCSEDVEARLVTECSDSCVDGSCVSITCDNDSECDDSDPYTEDSCVNPGSVDSYCEYEDITCRVNSDCNDNSDYTVDTCENPNTVDSFCSYEDVICLEDADCGIDGFVNDLSCVGDDVAQDYRSFNCENPGTVSASCTQTIEERIVTQCSDTCSEGSCVTVTCNDDNDCDDGDSETTDVCLNPGTLNSMCTHEDVLCSVNSDCGTDRYTGQLFCEGKSIFRNFASFSCNLPGSDASFCSNSIDAIEVYECTYACNEGSCIRCNTQSDCNDGDDGTVDICRFGGTIDSYCSHDVVSCFEDSECGEDSFTGAPFCIGDDVFQNFRDLSCKNAGSPGSFCDSNTEAQLIESCSFGCSEGSCVLETQCNNDDFDDDGDGVADELDPGCWDDIDDPSTYNPSLDDESRADIACNVASDCGFIDYLYPPFCENNEVIDEQDVYVCNNPGTGNSRCSIEQVRNVVDSCSASEVCLVDQCVNDCVDADSDGFDNCAPGMPDDDGKQLDCRDDLSSVNPGAFEVCNGIDDDCDGHIDEGCPVDLDGDGFDNAHPGEFGDDGKPIDCRDDVFEINPDALEICDGIDNNCDGQIDENADNTCQEGSVCSFGSCTPVACDMDSDCDDNDDYTIDTCNNPGAIDSFCSNKDVICLSDLDCDDNDNYTVDTCENPGTVDSFCSYDDIVCFTDGDCGSTTNGDNYCNEDLVVSDQVTFTCLNPGVVGSSCIQNTNQILIEVCSASETCNEGSCVVECFDEDNDGFDTCAEDEGGDDKPVDCNDNDASINPDASEVCDGIDNNCNGQIDEGSSVDLCGDMMLCESGQCVDVECDTDLDCGVDGFVGSDFCSEDDVFRNYETFTCNNPGTSISSCTSSVDPVLQDQCSSSEICLVDECVNDCKDNDNDGFDDCSNGPDDDGNPLDCNDNDENINPDALEICDGIDNNCDGLVDEVVDASDYHLKIVSDPSTKVSDVNDFIADKASQSAPPGSSIDRNWVDHFDGAHWLFFGRGGGFYYFEKSFNVPSLDVSDLVSKITIAADNIYEVRLNGQVIGIRGSPAYSSTAVHDLNDALVPGENTLRVRVDNLHDGSGGGLIYSVDIDGRTTSVCIPEEVCDDTPVTFGGSHGRVIRNFVDQTFDVTSGDEGFLAYSDENAEVVCDLLGYDELVDKHSPRRLSSPSDNTLAVWNGAGFDVLRASSGFRDRLDTVTCKNVC